MLLNCITLPQRREQIKSEIDRLGIEAKFWDATVLNNTIQAISLSHKKIVQWAKQTGLPCVAIAEDDCIFTSLNSWKYFLENIPEDYDIYLGNYYSGVKMPDNTIYGFAGLTCYIVNSRYYDTFLSAPINKNIDKAQAGLGKFVVCQPEIAKQRVGYSFHRKKMVDDNHYLTGRIFLTD